MEIKRDYYLQKLIAKKHNGLIKVITGIRRCGKSYLLFELFKRHLIDSNVPRDHIIEMSFDTFENIKYRDPNLLNSYIKDKITDQKQYYVLLDEVQLLGEFEAVLNGLARMKNVDVYVTGSNARFLSKDIITEFRGRGDELYLMPLSFTEFMSVYDGNKYDAWNEYLLYGGLPMVVLSKDPDQKIEMLKSLFSETYLNDILSRYNIRNTSEMEELTDILASNIGCLTNPKKLSDTFMSAKNVSISQNTIKSYIDYLEDAFLIYEAKRYDIKGKKYINTPKKYYFSDIGLRNARINFRQVEETHSMENIIYNELVRRGYNVDVGAVSVNNNNSQKRTMLEVDFVCGKASKRYYIQSALSMPDTEKLNQEQNSLLHINDSFKKIIITKDAPAPWYTDEGVLVIGVYDFLLDENSLDV